MNHGRSRRISNCICCDTQAKAQGCHRWRLCKACSTSFLGVKRLILSVFWPLGKASFHSEGCLLQWEMTLPAWLTVTRLWFIETCGRPAEHRNGFSLCKSDSVFIFFLEIVTAYPTDSPASSMVWFTLLPVIFWLPSIASYFHVPGCHVDWHLKDHIDLSQSL